jgi:hypothetical protein
VVAFAGPGPMAVLRIVMPQYGTQQIAPNMGCAGEKPVSAWSSSIVLVRGTGSESFKPEFPGACVPGRLAGPGRGPAGRIRREAIQAGVSTGQRDGILPTTRRSLRSRV